MRGTLRRAGVVRPNDLGRSPTPPGSLAGVGTSGRRPAATKRSRGAMVTRLAVVRAGGCSAPRWRPRGGASPSAGWSACSGAGPRSPSRSSSAPPSTSAVDGHGSLLALVAGHRRGRARGRRRSAPARRYLAFREARWTETWLRDRLFAHLQALHFAFHDRAQTGQLMSRANTDLQQIQAFVVMIPLTISNWSLVVGRHRDPAVASTRCWRCWRSARCRSSTSLAKRFSAPPAPGGDGRPAGVGRAGRGGRGDGRRRAGGQGLRRRGRAGRPAARPRPTTSTTASMRGGADPRRVTCRRSSCCPTSG